MEWVVKYEREGQGWLQGSGPMCLKRWLSPLEMGEGRGQQTLTWGCSWMEKPGWRLAALVLDFPWAFVHSPLSFIVLTTHVFPCRLLAPPVDLTCSGPSWKVESSWVSLSQVCIPLWVSWDGGGGPSRAGWGLQLLNVPEESLDYADKPAPGMHSSKLSDAWTDFGLGFCFRPELRRSI